MGRQRNVGRAWRVTSYGNKSTTPLELRGYGDEAMSPRLRRAPSRSSFQAEVAERGAKPLLQFRRVVGGIHGLSLSHSLFLGSAKRRATNPPRGGHGKWLARDRGHSGRCRGGHWRQCTMATSSLPIHVVPIDQRRCQPEPHSRANDFPSAAVAPVAARHWLEPPSHAHRCSPPSSALRLRVSRCRAPHTPMRRWHTMRPQERKRERHKIERGRGEEDV